MPEDRPTDLPTAAATKPIVAWHFTDPGCPWAYSSRPAIARLRWRFGEQIEWRLVLIGLSEDPRRYEERGYTPGRLASGHRKFERRFGMPFGTAVKPRMWGTSRACRVIIAAREIDPELGYAALRALQLMQFTTTDLLDDDEALRRALADVEGLDAEAVVARIDEPALVEAYEADRARARSADGTPSHVQGRYSDSDGPVRYTAPSVVFEHAEGRAVEVGGFQPFESYDNALANLDSSLQRRSTPASALEAVFAFPIGLTTAEVASIMRPSDLEDADISAAERELIAAADEGLLICEAAGSDALWREPRAGEDPPAFDRVTSDLAA
jgi:protein-disulfide isomerase-like protein with CxxC motif